MSKQFPIRRLFVALVVVSAAVLTVAFAPASFLTNVRFIGQVVNIFSTSEDTSVPQIVQTPPTEFEEVWVAAIPLNKGTKLDNVEKQLKKNSYPSEEVPSIAITNLEKLRDRTLTQRVDVDQFFTEEDFE